MYGFFKVCDHGENNETRPIAPVYCQPYGIIAGAFVHGIENVRGDVSELADEHDLGSCAERREGSIPSVPIKQITRHCEPRMGAAISLKIT